MPRFFVRPDAVCGENVTITGQDAHHISYSLRMAKGDEVTVCCEGIDYRCALETFGHDEVRAHIESKKASAGELPVRVRLCVALAKGEKLDMIVQKAVECGAGEILLFESSHCVRKLREDGGARLTERLARIAEEAAKQCGRALIPTILPPTSFGDMLCRVQHEPAFFCYEGEDRVTIKDALRAHKDARALSVIVGAEGGFSPEEAAAAKDAGCVSVGLGKRILRCETAPIYALSCISYEYEL